MAEDEHDIRRAAVDPDRLLPGEDPSHSEPGDAEHWASVYTELLSTKRSLIAHLREAMPQRSDAARQELERADVRMLELEAERFEKRLMFWRSKLTEAPGDQSAS